DAGTAGRSAGDEQRALVRAQGHSRQDSRAAGVRRAVVGRALSALDAQARSERRSDLVLHSAHTDRLADGAADGAVADSVPDARAVRGRAQIVRRDHLAELQLWAVLRGAVFAAHSRIRGDGWWPGDDWRRFLVLVGRVRALAARRCAARR